MGQKDVLVMEAVFAVVSAVVVVGKKERKEVSGCVVGFYSGRAEGLKRSHSE